LQNLRARPVLDDAAVLHDQHVMAQRTHHLQVMADEDVAETQATL
jgi:hypothetical protein